MLDFSKNIVVNKSDFSQKIRFIHQDEPVLKLVDVSMLRKYYCTYYITLG